MCNTYTSGWETLMPFRPMREASFDDQIIAFQDAIQIILMALQSLGDACGQQTSSLTSIIFFPLFFLSFSIFVFDLNFFKVALQFIIFLKFVSYSFYYYLFYSK